RNQDRTDLRDRIKRFELGVCVRGDVDNAVALLDAERLQGGRPAIAALQELLVREALVTIDDGLTRGVQATRTPGELEGCERDLQVTRAPWSRCDRGPGHRTAGLPRHARLPRR